MARSARLRIPLLVFKKFSNTFTSLLMAFAGVITVLLYLNQFTKYLSTKYFIARARFAAYETIDFERVQVFKIAYFLYKNTTVGATDA